MNPIMASNSIIGLMQMIQNKSIDPKAEVLKAIAGMDSNAKARLKQMLPQVQKIAQGKGVSNADISATMQEISSRL